MDFLLSRQPIFKPGMQLSGYELHSRPVGDDVSSESAETEAEKEMFSMLSRTGLDQINGVYSCVISVTPECLIAERWKALGAKHLVLGYFNEFSAEDQIGQKLLKLVHGGTRLSLSGELSQGSLYIFSNRLHSIKLDVTRFSAEALERKFLELKRYKAPILASRVDTYDDVEYCKTLGFDMYQGRFIARSAEKENKQIPANRLVMMRILSQLQNPQLSMEEVEKTISMDPALSYRLLTYVNSAAVALRQSVSSVGHALRLVGLDRLRAWASILLLSSVDDKPRELMTIALVRARMCEQLAEFVQGVDKESFFSVGLLSVVDALLDCSMEKALEELPLTEDVKSALINKAGTLGQALRCTLAYESSEWDNVQFQDAPPGAIRDVYMDALSWARKLTTGMSF